MTTPLPNVQALGCPRCGTAMYVGAVEERPLYGCGTCGGVWLDQKASARVIEVTCKATLQLAGSIEQSVPERQDEKRQHELQCPVCRASMQTTRVPKAWLDVDVCPQHGTWYDRGELHRVARTAHMTTLDWRDQPKPSQHGAMGAEEATDGERDWTDTAADIGGEIVAEAPALLIGLFFEALVGSLD